MALEDLLYPPHDYSKKMEIVDAIEQASQTLNNIEQEEVSRELGSISKELSGYASDMSEFVSDVLENDYHTACTVYFSNPEEFSFPFKDWENAKGLSSHNCKDFLNRTPRSTLLFDTFSIIKNCKNEVLYDLFINSFSNQYSIYYNENKQDILVSLLFMSQKNDYSLLSHAKEENHFSLSKLEINNYLTHLCSEINEQREETVRYKETQLRLTYLKPLAFLTKLAIIDENFRPLALNILSHVDKEFLSQIFTYLSTDKNLDFYSYDYSQKSRMFGKPSNLHNGSINGLIELIDSTNHPYFLKMSEFFITEVEKRMQEKNFASNVKIDEITKSVNCFKITIEKSILEGSVNIIDNFDNCQQEKKKVKI